MSLQERDRDRVIDRDIDIDITEAETEAVVEAEREKDLHRCVAAVANIDFWTRTWRDFTTFRKGNSHGNRLFSCLQVVQ